MIIKDNIAVVCDLVPRLSIATRRSTSLVHLSYQDLQFGFQSVFVLLAKDTMNQLNGDAVELRVVANLSFLRQEHEFCTKL
jgi:hypothetical protein